MSKFNSVIKPNNNNCIDLKDLSVNTNPTKKLSFFEDVVASADLTAIFRHIVPYSVWDFPVGGCLL